MLDGYATETSVMLNEDGSCTVEDNGRGIPTGIHPTEKVSAIQVVMTVLHAGGKFDGSSYKVSGGLHGVGASVVNALSSELWVEVRRNGKVYRQEYRRGAPLGQIRTIGETTERGTTTWFKPDSEIFTELDFNF